MDHDQRLVAGAGDTLEGPQLDVGLHDRVLELAADQALGIEDLTFNFPLKQYYMEQLKKTDTRKKRFSLRTAGSVFRVACNLVLCGIADQALERGPRKQHRLQSNEDFAKSWFRGYGTSDHRKHIRDALGVREGHVGRGGPVALIVCDDLDAVVLPHADTAVRGAKILTAAGHTAICIHESRVRVLGQLSTTCENGKPGPRQQCQSDMILCSGTTITTNRQAHSHGKPSVDTDCGLLGHGA